MPGNVRECRGMPVRFFDLFRGILWDFVWCEWIGTRDLMCARGHGGSWLMAVERCEKTSPLYSRVQRVKGLDVFRGNRRGIIFWEERISRFWELRVSPEVNLTPLSALMFWSWGPSDWSRSIGGAVQKDRILYASFRGIRIAHRKVLGRLLARLELYQSDCGTSIWVRGRHDESITNPLVEKKIDKAGNSLRFADSGEFHTALRE